MRPLESNCGTRAAVIFVLALALASIHAPSARGYIGAEGEPFFGISGYFKTPPRYDEPVALQIRIWGESEYDLPVTSVARISVPDGIEVLSGDTVSVARVDRHMRRRPERVIQLVVRPARYGSYVIRGSLAIDAGEEHGADETDFYLTLEVTPNGVTYARAPRTTRYENVRHGQRYRYGGRYLVPIDTTQSLLEEEITEKAKPIVQEAASCHGCPGPLPAVVPFLVMVGSDGRIRGSRFLDIQEEGTGGGTMAPDLVAAAGSVLPGWQFAPAKAAGLPVADYLVVRVPVKDGQP